MSEAPLNIPLLELNGLHCREITGTGADGLALYCGRPKFGRTSYCAHHRRINLVMVMPDRVRRHGERRRVSNFAAESVDRTKAVK